MRLTSDANNFINANSHAGEKISAGRVTKPVFMKINSNLHPFSRWHT